MVDVSMTRVPTWYISHSSPQPLTYQSELRAAYPCVSGFRPHHGAGGAADGLPGVSVPQLCGAGAHAAEPQGLQVSSV